MKKILEEKEIKKVVAKLAYLKTAIDVVRCWLLQSHVLTDRMAAQVLSFVIDDLDSLTEELRVE